MIELIIKGRPVSKKNSKQIRYNKRTGSYFPTSSKAFNLFRGSALQQLMTQRSSKPLIDETSKVHFVLLQKGRLTQDADNAITSIFDVLQEAGIVEDDVQIKHYAVDVINGCPDWRTRIRIEN